MTPKLLISLCIALISAIDGKDLRIIGGTEANLHEFPYHASLRRIKDDEHLCGGAIVNHWFILTTAHCVDIGFVLYSDLKIRIGFARTTSLRGSTLLPDRIFTHPKYTGRPNSITHRLNDIALIRVKTIIEFNEVQKKVLLPFKPIDNNMIGIVSGWGAVNSPPTKLAEKLQVAWMNILDNENCKPKIPFEIHDDQFCAFQKPGVGVCNGDGGSPMVHGNRIVGLVLSSRPYATGEPEIYIDVFKHIDFINSIIK